MKRVSSSTLIALSLALFSGGAAGQAYPTKAVRLIVSFPPGGATDTFSRTAAAELTKSLGQQVVVENRPGAGTTIAAVDPPGELADRDEDAV